MPAQSPRINDPCKVGEVLTRANNESIKAIPVHQLIETRNVRLWFHEGSDRSDDR